MTLWTPKPPLNGAAILLSASVPHPERDQRFLKGPLDSWLMLRVIEQRVDDAVRCLLAQVLMAGGRLVHGGHPSITNAIAGQAGNWTVAETGGAAAGEGSAAGGPAAGGPAAEGPTEGEPTAARPAPAAERAPSQPPLLLYQSQAFAGKPAPPGREAMVASGFAAVRWTPISLDAARLGAESLRHTLADHGLGDAWFEAMLPRQMPDPDHSEALHGQDDGKALAWTRSLREPLLVMRLLMLLETQPRAALCIGGMEGIEAEAELYADLCRHGLLPGDAEVQVLTSTFGASAQLQGEGIRLLDAQRSRTTPDTAAVDLLERLEYDGVMREFVAGVKL